MNRQFVVSVVATFVLSMLFGMLIHGGMLHDDYSRLVTMGVYRSEPEAQSLMAYMLAAHLIFAIGFTWIYRMGREDRAWLGQGVRFGLAVAVLTIIPTYLIYYVVTPLPSDLVAKQIVFDVVAKVVLGIAVAFLNRGAASTAR